MNGLDDSLSPEDQTLVRRFKDHPFLLVFLLSMAWLSILFSILLGIVSPALAPETIVEGPSAFDRFFPFTLFAAALGGVLIGFLAGTGTKTIEYAPLTAEEFRKGFLQKLTAAEGWAVERVSEKYLLFRRGKAQLLIAFEANSMVVKFPWRLFPRVRSLADQVRGSGVDALKIPKTPPG